MPRSVDPNAQPSESPIGTPTSEGLEGSNEGEPLPLEGSNQPRMNPFLPPGQAYPFQQPLQQYPYGHEGGQAYYHSFGYPQSFSQPVWDPYYQQYVYFAVPTAQQYQLSGQYYYSYQNPPPPAYQRQYESPEAVLPSPSEPIDVGAEPVLTITPHHLDIDIRDDQIILSTRACLSRPGFIHALVAFAVSGVVINTLSTFMDYLVRLNGAGREYTGIVGGSFQFVIMISSLIVGQFTDKTRAYYSVTVGMLVLGAFALAECGVSLDSDSGVQLRWALVIVAALVGPLQPVSTELGVDVVYPLSENTVLVIQQLFANLLSALFIPCFKAFKDFGVTNVEEGFSEKPEYTFSFYVLIVIHAAATVFFATFNGRYLRYEHELEKKAEEERRHSLEDSSSFHGPTGDSFYGSEQRPFIPPIV
jgi:Major Facilitator Superfamily